MIRFSVNTPGPVLEYQPELTSAEWVRGELDAYGEVTIGRAFTFKNTDLVGEPAEDDIGELTFRFRFATREDGYFRIAGRILGIANDVLIADITPDDK